LKPRAIQVLVEKRLAAARIAGASVHTLRHTFGTHHALNGTDLPVIRDMMGHSTIGTTEKYVHLAREVQKKQTQQNAL
jgi:site-specific recombinase XerD